jgi:hypothetical protein
VYDTAAVTIPDTHTPARQYMKLADDHLADAVKPNIGGAELGLSGLNAMRSIAASQLAIAEQLEQLTLAIQFVRDTLDRQVKLAGARGPE